MNEPIGQVYRIGQENPPIPGCTTSATAWQRDGFLLAHFAGPRIPTSARKAFRATS